MFSSFADCTRWNTSCCGIEPSIIVIHAAKNQRTSFSSGVGQEVELAVRGRVRDHRADAAGHEAAHLPADVEHAEHDDDHLDEVGDRHREHAAQHRVDEHGGGADDHAPLLRDRRRRRPR